jgi:hypothetical protein
MDIFQGQKNIIRRAVLAATDTHKFTSHFRIGPLIWAATDFKSIIRIKSMGNEGAGCKNWLVPLYLYIGARGSYIKQAKTWG